MVKYSYFPSQTPKVRAKSAIYTPKRDDEQPCDFYMGVPPGPEVVAYKSFDCIWNFLIMK